VNVSAEGGREQPQTIARIRNTSGARIEALCVQGASAATRDSGTRLPKPVL
jgi:hypothetical protein